MRLRHLPVLALLAVASQGLAQGCEGWNTSLFFLAATAAEVESCLDCRGRSERSDHRVGLHPPALGGLVQR